MRTVVFDIETTALEGVGAGILLCVCVRPQSTQRTRVFRIDSYHFDPSIEHGFLEREEKALLIDVLDELDKYDLLVGHNIERFDYPFLHTRAIRRDIPFTGQHFAYDTMKGFGRTKLLTVQNGFGKPSKGLAHVADLFGLEQEKTSIFPVEWWSAVWNKEIDRMKAMNHIIDHCKRDVSMNARLYDAVLPHDTRAVIRRML